MLVTYKPDGEPDKNREWEFEPTRVRANRAEMIEKRYGARYPEWVTEIQKGEIKARRVLLWHLMNLDHPSFKLEDVPDFMFEEVQLNYSIADLQKLRQEVDESSMDDDTKRDTLRSLDLEIATKMGRNLEELTPADLGKELPSESGASTS